MQVNLTLTPGYRLKISRAFRMSELVDRAITSLAALGGSAAFLEILRRWLQRRQDKRQEQLQLDVRIMEEGHALRQEAYQREREALQPSPKSANAATRPSLRPWRPRCRRSWRR
jgi:hypothetical protein